MLPKEQPRPWRLNRQDEDGSRRPPSTLALSLNMRCPVGLSTVAARH